jgi:hypothetical protein
MQALTRRGLAALAAALLAAACGYHHLDGRDAFGPDVRSIELFAFENETREPGLEQLITDALSEEFSRRGWLTAELEGQSGHPDLTMRGVLHSATVRSSSYSANALALEEVVDVTFDVVVRRVGTNETLWQHPGFHVSEEFLSSADPQVYASNKEQALRRVSSRIAERVHDELFQRF